MSILECRDIVKIFGGVVALNNANLTVREGEILGLVGPNGSGKTTFINLMSGQFKPTRGKIIFKGQDVTRAPANKLARMGLARTYQIPRPFASTTVIENVAVAAMFGRHTHNKSTALDLAMQQLEFVELADKAHLPVMQLNLHERKFLEMAPALALEPQLILLDEVLAGLNPSEVELGIQLIRRIHERGLTLVFVEHNMRAVMSLSDRITVLNYGQNVAEGDPKAVMENPDVIAAYLGQDYVKN
jgi:ABC-type branched-subunit amino acid transport system ATPase component